MKTTERTHTMQPTEAEIRANHPKLDIAIKKLIQSIQRAATEKRYGKLGFEVTMQCGHIQHAKEQADLMI